MKNSMSNILAILFTVVAVLAAGFAVLVAVQAAWIHGTIEKQAVMPGDYIFDSTYPVSLEEISGARDLADRFMTEEGQLRPGNEVSPEAYMTDGFTISVATLAYFNYLGALFADSPDLPSHLEKVKALLFEQLPEERAGMLYSLYESYLTCELELSEMLADRPEPKTAAEVVGLLAEAQQFRREYLGADVADALFGADIKTREYALRRSAVAGDTHLYGQEKEARIDRLTEEMWGDQAQAVNDYSQPFHRYREKLQVYARDMAEMETDAQREEMVKAFRNRYFSPEVVAQLEAIDVQMVQQQKADERFEQEKEQILGNDSLSREEKDAALRALAREVYGEQLLPPDENP
ncbi:MAG: lipase chaperone [Thermodesulfobacteriota bacterium]|nr:lipase chaperone [Thermodesulfobacteriota bacterium]